jgi:DNA polymerase I-like protein with 3'-5' exonuclease and polymerase domains
VHYCKIEKAIRAYNEDPSTDFHRFVANMLKIKRSPAKRQNFGMAYGMGKATVVKRLTSDEDIIETMGKIVNEMIASGELDPKLRVVKFNELCKIHAEAAYEEYHKEFPEIKVTSRRAVDVARMRGFVFNAYGRRRYLPGRASYKAFNTIIQSTAADNMKERMVAISPRYNSESRRWGIEMAASVHDEDLKEAPLEVLYDPELHKFVCDTLEDISVPCRVPILTGLGLSPNNWAEAADDKIVYDDQGKIIAGKIR